jgi:hypothetical protein
MEQLSLQLLLLSCTNKSNFVSILYLGLLLMFLLMKNKTKGMLYMSWAFGFTIITEYILSLTNLTTVNSPQNFPRPFDSYPCNVAVPQPDWDEYTKANHKYKIADCSNLPEYNFPFPWFLQVDFLYNNLNWAIFFSIDIEFY